METTRPPLALESESAILPDEGRRRVVIAAVEPEIAGGRFPIKRVVGDRVIVEADVFADGHNPRSGVLQFRTSQQPDGAEVPLHPLGNDRWRAEFEVIELAVYSHTLQAWVDHFKTWRSRLIKKIEIGQDVALELPMGAALVEAAVGRATGDDALLLRHQADAPRACGGSNLGPAIQRARSGELAVLMERYPDRTRATTYPKVLAVVVNRGKARFSTWYELWDELKRVVESWVDQGSASSESTIPTPSHLPSGNGFSTRLRPGTRT